MTPRKKEPLERPVTITPTPEDNSISSESGECSCPNSCASKDDMDSSC